MTPRLAVTEEQAEDIASAFAMKRAWESVTLRLPERPTMPWYLFRGPTDPAKSNGAPVPIPEGTRVRIEYPCPECLVGAFDARAMLDHRYGCQRCHGSTFVPVALATLAEVYSVHLHYVDGRLPTWEFVVTLSDIKPVEADQ